PAPCALSRPLPRACAGPLRVDVDGLHPALPRKRGSPSSFADRGRRRPFVEEEAAAVLRHEDRPEEPDRRPLDAQLLRGGAGLRCHALQLRPAAVRRVELDEIAIEIGHGTERRRGRALAKSWRSTWIWRTR